ncbi:alpha/beta hydrolase [Paenibacillus hodogayensis]|uniref:Alpha/beta hydrolase n=1 Tax=Paenibacillus hodogayensis TaxID=279208 RepID=A0ABV5W1S9_9BACL
MELVTRYYDTDIVLKRAVDIARPETIDRRTALFYIHGGGWHAGARDSFHSHLQHFSRKGYVCASAGYRLSPGAKMADQMRDLVAGYETFLAYIRETGLNIDHVVVLGSSAGAHLASLLALTSPSEWTGGTNPQNWLKPSACVSINGPGTLEQWEPMHEGIKQDIELAAGTVYGQNPSLFRQLSPIARVDANASDFLFLIVGKEQFFPHSFIYEMSDKLKGYGKRSEVRLFPDAEHGFFYGVNNPQQREALTVLEPFLASYV